nr:MAG TPA: hypothetical protein [Caudoviricetes sp.]
MLLFIAKSTYFRNFMGIKKRNDFCINRSVEIWLREPDLN